MSKDDEEVLCVSTSALEIFDTFPLGVRKVNVHNLLDYRLLKWIARGKCEHDLSWQQIIPYVVLRHGQSVFCYTRGKTGGEDRLHRKMSIGVGGHVSKEDAAHYSPTVDVVLSAAERELLEEVGLKVHIGMGDIVGVLRDVTDSVGSVHLGLLIIKNLDDREVLSMDKFESTIENGTFLSLEHITDDCTRVRLEKWSQHVLNHILGYELAEDKEDCLCMS